MKMPANAPRPRWEVGRTAEWDLVGQGKATTLIQLSTVHAIMPPRARICWQGAAKEKALAFRQGYPLK